MSVDPLSTLVLPGTRRAGIVGTPQSEPADERQVRNSAGGFTFVVDDLARLRRFLYLGTTGGTYYKGEPELTRENATVVVELARTRGTEVVAEVLAASESGRAAKNNPSLFALAAVAGLGDDDARALALHVLPKVARTGTHLFIFTGYAEMFRGWGRGMRRAVADWYLDRPADTAYQVAKYRQREGWSHRDLLRLAHPTSADPETRAVLRFAAGYDPLPEQPLPALLDAFAQAQTAATPAATARLIVEHGLSWEMVRNEHLVDPEVWAALLTVGMPQTALLRNLPRLTRLGLIGPGGPFTVKVVEQLTDAGRIRKGRIHPINVLIALRTYASGVSTRGDGTWSPSPAVVDALDAMFYAAFGNVEPTGKRLRLALDISGSMASNYVMDSPLSAREASAALAMASAAAEPAGVDVVGFTGTGLTPLGISPRRRLDDNVRAISHLPMGRTDCALPMVDALQRRQEVDTFVIYTDNETWCGSIHPHQALRQYREAMGIDARLVVVALTPTEFTIADPSDAGMLDVPGFDAAVPSLISNFARGLV